MGWLQRTVNVFRPGVSREIDEELAFHIAELTDELEAQGMSPAAAACEARKRFGNVALKREEARDMDILRSLETFLGDLRYGARQLRLNPGFASVAVLSLALGIGANSAIFQLINALRLKSLPVHEPSQLASIGYGEDFSGSGWWSGRHDMLTFAIFEETESQQQAFRELAAFATTRFNLSRGGEARYAEGLYVTPDFLDVLAVPPMLGRWLPADTDPRDCSGVGALLSHPFWQREYAGATDVIGKTISLDGREFPILAVTPSYFFGLEPARRFDVALPICADGLLASDGQGRIYNKTAWWLAPFGRLAPGWTVERAAAHTRDLSPRIFEATLPESYRPETAKEYLNNKLNVESAGAGFSSLRRQFENPLWILLASTALVLLIACANLANLLLARASAREREVALRQAVGASRRRLVGQLMSESLLLAVCGASLGGLVAYVLSGGMVAFLSAGGTWLHLPLGIDWRVFGFTAGLALLTCLLFGLAPALRAAGGAPADAMRGGRGSASGAERHGLRRALVVSQIALSFVLLVGALLFGQSLRNLLETETGIESEGVILAEVDSKLANLEPQRRAVVFRQLEEGIRALPEVEGLAMVGIPPFSGSSWDQEFHADEDPSTSGGLRGWLNQVSPGYFRTLGTPLLAGRDFTDHDDLTAPDVAIINQKMARELFGDDDPTGRRFRYQARRGETDPVFQVVGVVGDTKYARLREEQRPIAYFPIAQGEADQELTFAVRARGSFSNVMAGVKQRMAEVDPGLLVEFDILDEQVAQSVLRERLMANLSTAFGVLAAGLAALGLYGVMSYMVVRRRNEIGVRLALGAEQADIRGLVFSEAGRLVAIGLTIGLVGSYALSRYAESLLFGLEPNDAFTLALSAALLAFVAAAAAFIPVRRAARLDPVVVLRGE